MKKKIILVLISALLFAGFSARAAATKIYQIKTWKIQIEAPKNWKIKSEGRDQYFVGKNVLRFEIRKSALQKSDVNNWKRSKKQFLDGFAQEYANALIKNKLNVSSWRIKNFKIPGYSAGRVVYTVTGEAGNLKIDQVLIVKGKNLYTLSGFAKSSKFSKIDKTFILVFKSFKKY